jgi:hypothetical protein
MIFPAECPSSLGMLHVYCKEWFFSRMDTEPTKRLSEAPLTGPGREGDRKGRGREGEIDRA